MKPELFNSLRNYKGSYLVGDILAGLLVAIIALPLSIALGIQSGATLQQGIMTAIVAGFFISALGGTKFQIGGPTAAFVVILVGYISDPEIGFSGLQIATIFAGILLLILGFCRAGKLVQYIPFPIVIGFTTGIGITLMVGQLKDFLGLTVTTSGHSFVDKVSGYFSALGTTQIGALIVGIITLLLIIFIPKLNKKLPSAFIAITITTLGVFILQKATSSTLGIATIGSTYGDIKAEFNFIDFASFADVKWTKLITPVIVIAFLCAIESLLSATVADSMANTKSNPNQELVGQGVANIFSSLFGGLPATGAIARTAANIKGGAKSPLAGIFHAIFLLLMYLILMPIVKYIPLASLASVLIMVAVNMSNFKGFFRLMKFSVIDTIILIVTCLLTVFFDLTYGVIGGLILTVILMIPCFVKKPVIKCDAVAEDKQSQDNLTNNQDEIGSEKQNNQNAVLEQNTIAELTTDEISDNATEYSQAQNLENVENIPVTDDTQPSDDIAKEINSVTAYISGRICFITITKVLKAIDNYAEKYNHIVLDMQEVISFDATSADRLTKKIKELNIQNINLELVNINQKLQKRYTSVFSHSIGH